MEVHERIFCHTSFIMMFTFKLREGRRVADFPKLCMFLNNTVISEDI